MRKALLTIATIMAVFSIVSCTEEEMAMVTDAQAALDTVNQFQQDLDALKDQVAQLNEEVASLKTIIEELQSGGYITSVEEITQDGRTGYTITFNDGRVITVLNGADGQDGKDGYSPQLSVYQDSDGVYYWKLDGEWLLDQDGNRIPAYGQNGKDGQDGEDGKDGITPQLKIDEGYWYISYDDGQTWQQLGKASGNDGNDGQDGVDGQNGQDGKDGDSFFQRVDLSDPNYVTFVLSDGSTFKLPRFLPVGITFNVENDVATITAGETIVISYELTNATDKTKVSAASDGFYGVRVVAQENGGTLEVTAPEKYRDGCVNVFVDNGEGYVSLHVINFTRRSISFADGLKYTIGWEGGEIQMPLISNFDYKVELEGTASEWLSVIQTKGQIEGTIVLDIARNENKKSRTGYVFLYPLDGDGTYRLTAEVHQKSQYGDMALLCPGREFNSRIKTLANEYEFVMEKTDYSILHMAFQTSSVYEPSEGDVYVNVADENSESPIYAVWDKSSRSMTIHSPLDSIWTGPECADMFYKLTCMESLDLSSRFNTRNATAMFDMFAECDSLKTLDVSMLDVSHVNEFYGMFRSCKSLKTLDLSNFAVNWEISLNDMFADCESLETLNISSFAPRMIDCCGVFENCKSLKSLDVSKWDTSNCWYANGTRDLFCGCSSLTYLDVSNFDMSKVTNVLNMFADCSSLETLILGDFDTRNATWMQSVFTNCSSLESLDLGNMSTDKADNVINMFAGCSGLKTLDLSNFNTSAAVEMSGMFSDCSNLETIIGLSHFDTSNAEHLDCMFSGCKKLGNIDIRNFKTSKCKSMAAMFRGCESMTSIDISSFETPYLMSTFSMFAECRNLVDLTFGGGFYTGYVEDMREMFASCEKLKNLDLSFFDTSDVRYIYNLFMRCHSLETLDISGFNLDRVIDDNWEGFFYECYNMKRMNLGLDLNWDMIGNSLDGLADSSMDCTIICNEYTRAQFKQQSYISSHPGWFHFIDTSLGVLDEFVDLGLSVLWATTNLGAFYPEGRGNYYAWGETQPKSVYTWETYKWASGDAYTKYCTDANSPYYDDAWILLPEDDPATLALGEDCRIPIMGQWDELVDNCTWTVKTINGMTGYEVTSNIDGYTDKSIFLPLAGCWQNWRRVGDTLVDDYHYVKDIAYYRCQEIWYYDYTRSYYLSFDCGELYPETRLTEPYRYDGASVRAIKSKN